MSQYRVGTVTVTNGNYEVIGTNTLWYSSGIQPGWLFACAGDNVWYYIADVVSDTVLRLTSPYSGTSASGVSYTIVRDYTYHLGLPLINYGDSNWPLLYNESMVKIDNTISSSSGLEGSGYSTAGSLDQAYRIGEIVDVNGPPIQLFRIGTYPTAQERPALIIEDTNQYGLSELPPPKGSIVSIYSKHSAPFIAVTNNASRTDPLSVSQTAKAGVIGLAWADEQSEFPSYGPIKNIGIVGMAVDYHNAITVNSTSNVGVYAFSQRGYGLSASSSTSYAAYLSSPVPLFVTNANFIEGESQFNTEVQARKGGLKISSSTTPTDLYPSIRIEGGGTAIYINGGLQKIISNTSPGLYVSTSNSNYAIETYSNSFPSIRSHNGINIAVSSVSTITNPTEGTIVYDESDDLIKFRTSSSWIRLLEEGSIPTGGTSNECCSLQDSYDVGRTINCQAFGAVSITSSTRVPVLVLQSENSNVTVNPILHVYSYGPANIELNNTNSTSSTTLIKCSANSGTILKAQTTNAGLISYTNTSSISNTQSVIDINVTNGKAISINSNDSATNYPVLNLSSKYSPIIQAFTHQSQFLSYTVTGGTIPYGLYALDMNCASGKGLHISSNSDEVVARIESASSPGTILEILGIGSDKKERGISVIGTRTGIYTEGNEGYALEAHSTSYPSVKSLNGIVLYSSRYYSVPNPPEGTLVYDAFDKMFYYYAGAAGWQFLSASGGITPPSGGVTCDCINGVLIYSSNINNILDPIEGTIVYNAIDKTVYVHTGESGFIPIASGAGGGGGGGVGIPATKGTNFLVTGSINPESNVASFIMPCNGIIRQIKASVDVAPVGNNIVLNINLNGSSITPSGIVIPADQTESQVYYLSSSAAQHDVISLDIDQVGSSVAGGNDLRVLIVFEEVYEKGIVIYSNNINNIENPIEGTIVYNAIDEKVYVYTHDSGFRLIGSDGKGTTVSITSDDSPYTVSLTKKFIFAEPTSGDISVILPAASASEGIPYVIKRCLPATGNNVIITTNGGTIDGMSSITLTESYERIQIISNGTNYYII